eukprot:10780986-Alexandrium_andersonii.AAC.1
MLVSLRMFNLPKIARAKNMPRYAPTWVGMCMFIWSLIARAKGRCALRAASASGAMLCRKAAG